MLILLVLFLGLQLIYLANFVFIRNSKLGKEYLNMYKTTHQFYLFFNYFKKANSIINKYLGNTTGYYFNFKYLDLTNTTSSTQGYLGIKGNKIDCFIFSDFITNYRSITNETKVFFHGELNYTTFYINNTLISCISGHSRTSSWVSPKLFHINNTSGWKNCTIRELKCTRMHLIYTKLKRNGKYAILIALIDSMLLGKFKSYPNGTYMTIFVPKNNKFYYTIKMVLSPGKMKIILKNHFVINVYKNNSITYDFVKSLALKKLKPILAKTTLHNNANQIVFCSGPNGVFTLSWPKVSQSLNTYFNNTTVYAVCRSRKNIENIKIIGEGEWIPQNF